MKHPITKKSLVGLLSAALIAAFTAVIPSTANATEGCTDQSVIVGKKNVGFEKIVTISGSSWQSLLDQYALEIAKENKNKYDSKKDKK